MQLHPDSASVESCVVFMPGNNRQRVARPFGRRFVNSEVTHAFTTGKFSIRCRGTSPGTYGLSKPLAFAKYSGFHHRLNSVGEHSTGAVHRNAFPNSCLVLRGYASASTGAAPADILFRTLHFTCCFGRKYLPSSTTDCVSDASLQNRLESRSIGAHNKAESAQKHEFARAARRPRKKGLSR